MLRVFVTGGGTSDMQYGFTFDEAVIEGVSGISNRSPLCTLHLLSNGYEERYTFSFLTANCLAIYPFVCK